MRVIAGTYKSRILKSLRASPYAPPATACAKLSQRAGP